MKYHEVKQEFMQDQLQALETGLDVTKLFHSQRTIGFSGHEFKP